MKVSKKIFISFCLIIVLVMSGIVVYAHENISVNDTEVVFQDNSIFTDEEKEIIESVLLNEEQYETYGLKCTLFGHDYKEEMVETYTHKVYLNAPRCVLNIYEVKICSNCSDTQQKLLVNRRVDCCN